MVAINSTFYSLVSELVDRARNRWSSNPIFDFATGKDAGINTEVTIVQEASAHAGLTYQIHPNNTFANSCLNIGNGGYINGGGDTVRATDALSGYTTSRFEFIVDNCDAFSWLLQNASEKLFRVEIDGKYTSLNALTTDNGLYVYGTFAAPGRHAIAVERMYAAGVASLYLKPTAQVIKPVDRVVSAAFVGDSYVQGTGTLFRADTWCNVLGRILGWSVAADGQGGSGYVNPGTNGKKFAHPDRLAYLTGKTFDVVGIAGGINDASAPYAPTVQAEALAYYQAVRALQPRALIVVFGAFAGSTGPSSGANSVQEVEASIKGAYDQWADPNSIYVPISNTVTQRPWIRGTGKVGATNGSGNADVYIGGTDGNDGTHPYQRPGHWYLGRRGAEAILGALQSKLTV